MNYIIKQILARRNNIFPKFNGYNKYRNPILCNNSFIVRREKRNKVIYKLIKDIDNETIRWYGH